MWAISKDVDPILLNELLELHLKPNTIEAATIYPPIMGLSLGTSINFWRIFDLSVPRNFSYEVNYLVLS